MTYTTIIVGLDSSDNFITTMTMSRTWYDVPPYVDTATMIFKSRLQVLEYIDALASDNNKIRVIDMTTTSPTTYYRTSKERYLFNEF